MRRFIAVFVGIRWREVDVNDWEIGDPIGERELLWVDWVSGGDVE